MKDDLKYFLSNGSVLVAGMLLSDFLNFIFNAFLGRNLSFENLGLVTLINTLWYLIAIPVSALASAVNFRGAYLTAHVNESASAGFVKTTLKRSILIASVFSLLWIVATPLLTTYFQVDDPFTFWIFAPAIALGAMAAIIRAFLHGNLYFKTVALIYISESATKLCIAILFTVIHREDLVPLAIPLSIFSSFAIALLSVQRSFRKAQEDSQYIFPTRYFAAAFITAIATTAFLTLDVILVKHFLNPIEAGQYALLSLFGKIVFFLGSILNNFVVTFASRDIGAQRNPNPTFYRLFSLTFALVSLVFISFGLLGKFTVPIFFGERTQVILPYLTFYTLAIALFTLSNTLTIYHLVRQHYLFSLPSIATSIILMWGINVYHNSINQVTQVVLVASFLNFLAISQLHFLQQDGRFILSNLIDLFYLLFPKDNSVLPKTHKRILIFNWRDTRHVYAGGAEVYINELAKRWVQAGHHVTLFCGNDGKSKRNEVIDDIHIIRRGGFYFVYLWAFLYYIFHFKGRFDVIIDCHNGIPFFTPLYVTEPVFCLMYHVHQEVFRRSLIKPLALIATILESYFMPYVYKHTKFITISESTKFDMLKLGITGGGIDVVYPGVDIEHLKPGEKSQEPLIVYLGRLKKYKSVNILILAFKDILKRVPKARLVIAGSGETEASLKKLVTSLGIQQYVEFKGRVSEQEKIDLLQKAWVFVNPSYMEGWGITTIEANACGTPVVASLVPGLKDSVQNPHTGYLVPSGNPQAFASRITELIRNDNLRRKMSDDAITWAHKFNWQNSADQSLKIIL